MPVHVLRALAFQHVPPPPPLCFSSGLERCFIREGWRAFRPSERSADSWRVFARERVGEVARESQGGSDVITKTALKRINWSLYKINQTTDKVGVFVSIVSTKIPYKGAGKEYIGEPSF